MKITITNKCKEYILKAENGIKFQVKGYAFLVDNEKIVASAGDKLADLQLKNLYRKDPTDDDELIVYDPTKPSNVDVLYKLFDTTYIPSLELKSETGYNFGSYKIRVDQGLDPTKPGGFCCEDYNCDRFDAILVIGELCTENRYYISEQERSFLAAIIQNDTVSDGFKLDKLTPDSGTPSALVINWQFNLSELPKVVNAETHEPEYDFEATTMSAEISDTYLDMVKDATLKDHQTTQITKENPLFLVPQSGLNYDDVINNIIDNTNLEKGIEGEPSDIKGEYYPSNIILADETEKINNIWNSTASITIFDDHKSPIAKPQLLLTYGKAGEGIFNSIAVTYDRPKGVFSINQATGNDDIQAEIFPEDLHEENKHCLDPEIKPYNHTVISSWSATSGNSRYFKLHSNGGSYTNGTHNTFEFNSFGNNLSNAVDTTFLNSKQNTLAGAYNLMFVESKNNSVENMKHASFIGSFNTLIDTTRSDILEKNRLSYQTFIGTDTVKSLIRNPGNTNHITFIGNNTYSQFNNQYNGPGGGTVHDAITHLSDLKTIKGRVTITDYYDSVTKSYTTKSTTASIEYLSNGGYLSAASADFVANNNYSALNNEYASLIGFQGLVLNKNYYNRIIYPFRKYIGSSKSLNEELYMVSADTTHTPTATNPNDYTLVFGSYNACIDPYGIHSYNRSISSLLETEYGYWEVNLNSHSYLQNVSSVYKNPASADPVTFPLTVQGSYTAVPFSSSPIGLYFKNQQDNYYCTAPDSVFNAITADEGDFSLNKIVVVGDGECYDETDSSIFTPAENVAKVNGFDSIAKRIDLFSIEQNSFQLVHNNNYDLNPSFSATKVEYIPGMFAVRDWEPIVQTYHYRFTSARNTNTHETIIKKDLVKSINKFNLQNAVYTTSAILFPMQRSSNDEYKLNINTISDYIKGSTITGITRRVNFSEYTKKLEEFTKKRYTFVYKTKGVKNIKGYEKGSKGTKGKAIVDWRYKMYIEDVFSGLSKKGVTIKTSGLKGIKSRVYTIYLVNENPIHTLTFKGIRMRKVGANYQTLMTTRYIHPGKCQRIMFVDNGANGEYGVMNFDYFNPNNNTFMTK
jgi:hypothetical protein